MNFTGYFLIINSFITSSVVAKQQPSS